ncbi:MAG: FAD-binding oxidoreductase [Hyphomicrobium sp.]|jgi:L-gulonolactone oxidase
MIFEPGTYTSWGRIARVAHPIGRPRYRDEIAPALAGRGNGKMLAVGLGRSYGDSVLNSGGALIDMSGLDRVMAFDVETGVLRAEAGLSLDVLLRLIVPRGWFLATTPGTRFVTLGGAVANDVHGKNHHMAGSFGCSVRRLGLVRSDGSHHELDRETGGKLLLATIGGLGLTGIITWVEVDLVRIPSAILDVERIPFANVGSFFRLAEASAKSFEHTVAWIDCANGGSSLGRGIFQRANWCEGELTPHASRLKAVVPFEPPSGALNGFTVRAFNSVYYRMQKRGAPRSRQHYATFFYPLDAIGKWNRLYGRRGFYQYQCVIGPEHAEPAVTELVKQIARVGAGSFLAVLKTLGSRSSGGLLSFPRAGATLALDFANRGDRTLELLGRLDKVVLEAGGRLYPAKDGRVPAAVFRAGYGENLPAFTAQVDPGCSSDFWRRVSA